MQRGLLVEFSCNPHSLLDSPLESFAGCEIICPWVTSGCYNIIELSYAKGGLWLKYFGNILVIQTHFVQKWQEQSQTMLL